VVVSGAHTHQNLDGCHTGITAVGIKKYKSEMPSDGMTFIPSFITLSQLVHKSLEMNNQDNKMS
jgi:hypothetical protein